jgi:cytochrome c peroxidase
MRHAALALAGLLAGCGPGPAEQPSAPPLGLPALQAPADNPVSPAKVELGRKLFLDRRLSPNGTMSCAMCHVPEQGFTSNEMGTAIGLEGRSLRRNAPALYNVAYFSRLFHDGREITLENQVWGPLLAENEMGNASIGHVVETLRFLPDYAGRFEAAFGGRGPDMQTIGQAIAAYERTLLSGNSRFDRWRYGNEAAALAAEERLGFELFTGKAGCAACHTVEDRHALFTDQRFHNTGIGWARSMAGEAKHRVRLAPGVFTEIAESETRSFSAPAQDDVGRFEITQDPADRWAYRTPGLRNIALTAPYMHDGSIATLEEVVDFYDRGGIENPLRDPLIRPLGLSPGEKRALAAFLRTLTGDNAEALAREARRNGFAPEQ